MFRGGVGLTEVDAWSPGPLCPPYQDDGCTVMTSSRLYSVGAYDILHSGVTRVVSLLNWQAVFHINDVPPTV